MMPEAFLATALALNPKCVLAGGTRKAEDKIAQGLASSGRVDQLTAHVSAVGVPSWTPLCARLPRLKKNLAPARRS